MANPTHTQVRTVRVDQELWTAFGEAAEAHRTIRSRLLIDFMMWYTHAPGGQLPERPDKATIDRVRESHAA